MPVQTFEQEWRSGNQETAYPFTDQVRPEQIPSDFLIDLQAAFAGDLNLNAVVTQVTYDGTADAYTITVSINGVPFFGAQQIPRLFDNTSRVGKKVIVVDGGAVMILQPGRSWDNPSWGGVSPWTYIPAAAHNLQPANILRQPQTFRRIFIDHLPIPPENEWPMGVSQRLMAGYNLEFTDQPFEFAPVLVPSRQSEDIWSLRASPGAGAGFPGNGNPAIDYVATFQGKGSDSGGNFAWNGEDCIRVSIPDLDGVPIPNTVQIASDCQPCCPCGEYRKVAQAVSRRSAKIKDYCDEVAATILEAKVVYEEGVVKVNNARPPMALVRNVRCLGAHIIYTVSNVSETPIFVYVATDILAHLGTSPLPLTAESGATSTVSDVTQVGFPTIDLAIDSHRLTLPPLDFNSQENPLAAFPSATFTPIDNAESLVVVGAKTLEQAFAPIPPGATVEVRLFSQVVQDEIEAMITGPSSFDTEAERNAIISKTMAAKKPKLRFRSVAVYGASHAYPCTGETYTVQIAEFPDDDVIREICEVNLERRYQAVDVNKRNQVGGQG